MQHINRHVHSPQTAAAAQPCRDTPRTSAKAGRSNAGFLEEHGAAVCQLVFDTLPAYTERSTRRAVLRFLASTLPAHLPFLKRFASFYCKALAGERAAAAAATPAGAVTLTAWAAACDRMGRTKAAICILLLDANRDHAVNPVRNPGGALRGMIKAHNRGKLNIIGSLIGLHRRRGL